MASLPGKNQATNSKASLSIASSKDGWERVSIIGLTQGPKHWTERSKRKLICDNVSSWTGGIDSTQLSTSSALLTDISTAWDSKFHQMNFAYI